LLPIWQLSLRLSAYYLYLTHKQDTATNRILKLIVALSSILLVVSNLYLFVTHPVSYSFKSITSIYGYNPSSAIITLITLSDLIVFLFFFSNAIRLVSEKSVLFALYSLLIFWVAPLASSVFRFLVNDTSKLTFFASLVGLHEWSSWIFAFIIGLLSFSNYNGTARVRSVLIYSAAVLSLIIIIQFALSDYSYFLGVSGQTSFGRVKGPYYYHAEPTFLLSILFFQSLTFSRKFLSSFSAILPPLLILVAIALNSIRSVSLTVTTVCLLLSAFYLYRREFRLLIAPLIAIVILSQSIFVLKPAYPQYLAPTQNTSKDIGGLRPNSNGTLKPHGSHEISPSTSPTIDQFTTANAPRSILFSQGLTLIPNNLLFGTGVVVLKIPLSGYLFGGITDTYSTHSLLLDITLMGGAAGGVSFLIFLCISVIRSFIIYPFDSHDYYLHLTNVASILAFTIGSFFFPQEHNEILTVVFAVLSLSFQYHQCRSKNSSESNYQVSFSPVPRLSYPIFFLSLLSLLNAIILSPVLIFPSIELFFRHRSTLLSPNITIFYTDSRALAFGKILSKLLVPSVNIQYLDPKIPLSSISNSFIVWSPAAGLKYPKLIADISKTLHHPNLEPLGISTPYNWWIIPSLQQSSTLIRAGGMPNPLAADRFFDFDDSSPQRCVISLNKISPSM